MREGNTLHKPRLAERIPVAVAGAGNALALWAFAALAAISGLERTISSGRIEKIAESTDP